MQSTTTPQASVDTASVDSAPTSAADTHRKQFPWTMKLDLICVRTAVAHKLALKRNRAGVTEGWDVVAESINTLMAGTPDIPTLTGNAVRKHVTRVVTNMRQRVAKAEGPSGSG